MKEPPKTEAQLLAENAALRDQLRELEAERWVGEAGERRLRSIVEGIDQGVWATDPDGRTLYLNERMAGMLGYTVDEMLGRSVSDYLHPDARSAAPKIFMPDSAQGAVQQDLLFEHSDGRSLWAAVTTSPLTDAEGEFVGLLNTVSDISERKDREVRLKQSSDLFRQFGDAVDDVVWITDWPQQSVAYVNRAYEAVWGRRRLALYKNPHDWVDGIHPGDRERIARAFERDILRGTYDETFRVLRPDGSVRWIRDRGFPVRDARGRVYRVAGIAEDVTERQRVRAFREGQSKVLEGLATGRPLPEVLELLVEMVEEQTDEMLCSVLLLDEAAGQLRHGAAPSLPDHYNEAIDGVAIGPRWGPVARRRSWASGSSWRTSRRTRCGRATGTWHGRPGYGRAGRSRSSPSGRTVLGTFAMYYREPRRPTPADLEMIEAAAYLAAVAIEFRRATGRILDGEMRQRQIIDLVPHMIFAKDREGRFLLANRAVAEAYGLSVQRILGTKQGGLHSDEDEISDMLADDLEVLESGRPKFIPEEEFTDRSGKVRVLETTKIPFLQSGTDEPAILGVAIDITERRALERQLSEYGDRVEEIFLGVGPERFASLGQIYDSSTDFFLTVGRDGRVIEANRTLRDALGLTREEIEGVPLETVFPQESHGALHHAVERLRSEGAVEDLSCELVRRDGSTIPTSCRGVARDGANGQARELRLVLHDRTRRARLERRLVQTEQLVTTGRLAAGVAHEINNPLQALLMHTDVVETELPPDFAALDSWRSIKQGIRHIRQVVNDLLDLHRIGKTRRERVDINTLVEEAMRLADSQLQARGIVQSADLDKNLPQIYGVSQHLYQIILNLLLNGAEAVGHDGSISVSTHGSDDSVFVEILDSGKGITPDELAQIFTPLYTGRKGRGTGLGLFVTYSLIKEHNGDIEVESRSGEGTRFRVRFPRAETESTGDEAR